MKQRSVNSNNSVYFIVLFFAFFSGCGSRQTASGKEGNIDDLLNPVEFTEEIPLASKSLKVEQIATELPIQKDEYTIGPNDVLNIIVLGHEEFSSARDFNRGIVGTVVKKDGNIYVPILGKVKAEGFTVEQFNEVFFNQLKNYLKEPQLTVDILKYESKKFFVLGQVNTQGAFPVDGKTTLLEAIGLAKGVTPDGNLERGYVIRNNILLPINLADLLLRGETSRNIFMKSGDLVFIPDSEDQMVYVLGEVREPGVVRIKSGRLSLGQALAQTGGLLPIESDKGSIKLIRGSWQEPTIYTLNYKTVLENGDRIMLRPGDRVVVDPTTLTTVSRYMEQILPFLVGADHATNIIYKTQQVTK